MEVDPAAAVGAMAMGRTPAAVMAEAEAEGTLLPAVASGGLSSMLLVSPASRWPTTQGTSTCCTWMDSRAAQGDERDWDAVWEITRWVAGFVLSPPLASPHWVGNSDPSLC